MSSHRSGHRRSSGRLIALALAATVLPAGMAEAQSRPRVRVMVEEATVTTSQRASGQVVTRVAAGDVFDVMHLTGDPYHHRDNNWYLVLLPNDAFGWPHVGWLSGRDVEELAPAEPEPVRPVPARSSTIAPAASSASSPAPAPATAPSGIPAAMAAATAPVERAVVPDAIVLFAFDSSELTAEGTSTLDCTMEMVVADGGEVSFAVEGHTDASGPDSYNERLGLARAEAVKAYLVQQHRVPADEIAVVSYGEGRPASSNDTRDGRASNRRVVVTVGG